MVNENVTTAVPNVLWKKNQNESFQFHVQL